MAYSVNWLTKLITIPLSDLVWSVGNTYELALSSFLDEIRRLEYAFGEGLWAPQILDHTNPKTISGVTYSAFDELLNGYTIQFSGSPDAVVLKGTNNNILDVYLFNGVSVAPNNSAGLQDLSTILVSAYNGEVCMSLSKGIVGTSIPIGARSKPSNNFPQVLEIAEKHGINRIRLLEAATLDSTAQFLGHNFVCDNAISGVINILPDAGVFGCTFGGATVTGTLDGDNILRDCAVYDLLAVRGILHQVSIIGAVQVQSGGLLNMMDCHSGVAGGGLGQTAEIDMDGDGSLRNSNYTGGINLINCTGGGDISMDVNGRVIVEASCSGGDVYIRGNALITDNSTGTCTVYDQTINKDINAILAETSYIKYLTHCVYIDTEKADVGDGSVHYPFNNITDAIDFAEQENIPHLTILSDIDIDRDIKNFVVNAIGTPTVDTGSFNIDGCEFYHCKLRGDYTGSILAHNCNLAFAFTLNGGFNNCRLGSTFIIPDGGSATIKDSSSFSAVGTPPTFDIGGVTGTARLDIVNHNGGVNILNCNKTTDNVKVLMNVGRIIIDSSCGTNGTMTLGGMAIVTNNGTVTNYTDNTINPDDVKDIKAIGYNKRETTNTKITLYEEDGITVKKEFNTDSNITFIDPI